MEFSDLDNVVKNLANHWKNREQMDVDGLGILQLSAIQRAIIAARLSAMHPLTPRMGVPLATLGPLLQVPPDTIERIKVAVLWPTPGTLESLWNGRISIREAHRRATKRRTEEASVARPVRQYDTERSFRSEIYQKLKSALLDIGSLPSAKDVAAIAKEFSRNTDVDSKLPVALRWLEEFSNEWRNRNDQTPA